MSGPPIPECWDYKGGHPIYAVLGIKVQCFMHARWGLYPLSHMPSPRMAYVSYKKIRFPEGVADWAVSSGMGRGHMPIETTANTSFCSHLWKKVLGNTLNELYSMFELSFHLSLLKPILGGHELIEPVSFYFHIFIIPAIPSLGSLSCVCVVSAYVLGSLSCACIVSAYVALTWVLGNWSFHLFSSLHQSKISQV